MKAKFNTILHYLFTLMTVLFISISCSNDDTSVNIDDSINPHEQTKLDELKQSAIDIIQNSTNLTSEEKESFKEQVRKTSKDTEVNSILEEINHFLPIDLKGLQFVTLEKNEIIDGKDTGWIPVKQLANDQEAIFKFLTKTALRGKIYIEASRIANYKHTYDIVEGDKFVYNRAEKLLITTISTLNFHFKIENYNHDKQEIVLKFFNYNSGGKDYPAGVPYDTRGKAEGRYQQNIYFLKMKVENLKET